MPPVEVTSSPLYQEVQRRPSLGELKVMEKAMEIPVVHDTLEELERVRITISENTHVKSARQMVEEGIKLLSENQTLQVSMKVFENPTIQQTMTAMKDTLGPAMTSVNDLVNPWVANAVEQLDNLACGSIDSLTAALPALNNPTPELVESTKETARTYFSLATEYISSFSAAQISLRLADKTLSFAEKSAGFFKPDKKDDGLICTTYSKIRETRRSLRALRRAGHRRRGLECENSTGLLSQLASFFSLNHLLRAVGLELAPVMSKKKVALSGEDETNTNIKDLQGNLSGYKSEEDPDYVPDSGEDSLDETDTDDETAKATKEQCEKKREAGESQGEENLHQQ